MDENHPLLDPAQVLKDAGISAQPSQAARLTFVNFIRRGNSVGGENVEERIELLKKLQATWLGKRVRIKDTEPKGRVMYLVADSLASVQAKRFSTGRHIVVEAAFYAMISWERGKPTKVRLIRLQIVEDPPTA